MAYDARGKAAATEEVLTADAPHHLRLVADRPQLTADGEDLAYITARVEDAQGNLCPGATPQLRFAVTGAGHFRAIANGDATCLEPFQPPQMPAFQGQLVALVAVGEVVGTVQVRATAAGLQDSVLQLRVSN